jgi:hypothetical protein
MLAGWKDYVLSAAFILLWLIPIAYVGLFNRPMPFPGRTQATAPRYFPEYIDNLHRVTCLFTRRVGEWSNYYFQVQLEGSPGWIEVPQEDYGQARLFGYRTRLFRMLRSWSPVDRRTRQTQALAEFIKTRHEQLYPELPDVEAVRFVLVLYTAGEDALAHPPGRWERPPLAAIEPERKAGFVGLHYFDGRPPVVKRTARDHDEL